MLYLKLLGCLLAFPNFLRSKLPFLQWAVGLFLLEKSWLSAKFGMTPLVTGGVGSLWNKGLMRFLPLVFPTGYKDCPVYVNILLQFPLEFWNRRSLLKSMPKHSSLVSIPSIVFDFVLKEFATTSSYLGPNNIFLPLVKADPLTLNVSSVHFLSPEKAMRILDLEI